MKQVAHRIDEDHPGLAPVEGLIGALGPKHQVKTAFKRMSGRPPESVPKRFRVAIAAARTNLRAPLTGFQVVSVHSIVVLFAMP